MGVFQITGKGSIEEDSYGGEQRYLQQKQDGKNHCQTYLFIRLAFGQELQNTANRRFGVMAGHGRQIQHFVDRSASVPA